MKYAIEENKLKVTKTTYNPENGEPTDTDYFYELAELITQREMITSQRDEMIASKERELAEVDLLIAKYDELIA